jgi:hypothetical protein
MSGGTSQKKQKRYYSGKKKRHTQKAQVIVDKPSRKIICTNFEKGRRHDFRLFKTSGVRFLSSTSALVDTGYLGLQKLHANTTMPKKKSKKQPLTKEDKTQNRKISSERVPCENVIGCLKRFRIIAEKYRNRRKRFGLRFNLIAAIYNLELAQKSGEL